MGQIGIGQIAVIIAVAAIFIGYKKLPDLGRSLGQSLRNFKRSLDEPDEIDLSRKEGKKPGARNKGKKS